MAVRRRRLFWQQHMQRDGHDEKLGIHAQVTVDFPSVMSRVRSIRDRFNQGVKNRLENAGVKIVRKPLSLKNAL